MQRMLTCLCLAMLTVSTWGIRQQAPACTVGVISGRATADGRPLLWKNRDTSEERNEVRSFTDGRYRYVALINSGSPEKAWAGVNEHGFGILNSLATDLPGGSKTGPGNGRFMKMALGTCTTVAEFQALLAETNRTGRRTKANFAVIDAQGGAVIFEAGHKVFRRFDANDPDAAPQGFIVRTNFAFTGGGEDGRERFRRCEALCTAAMDKQTLNYRFLLEQVCRDLETDPQIPAREFHPRRWRREPAPKPLDTETTINRTSTTSAVVLHGVARGEDPRLATFWAMLGQPVFAVAVPYWVDAAAPSPGDDKTETASDDVTSLCALAVDLKQANYEARQDEPALLNVTGLPTVWSATQQTELEILEQTEHELSRWRATTPTPSVAARFHRSMTTRALKGLQLAWDSLQTASQAVVTKPAPPTSKAAVVQTAQKSSARPSEQRVASSTKHMPGTGVLPGM